MYKTYWVGVSDMKMCFGDKHHKNSFNAKEGSKDYEDAKAKIAEEYAKFIEYLNKSYTGLIISPDEFREQITTQPPDFRRFSFLPNFFRTGVLASVLSELTFENILSDLDWFAAALERLCKCLSREGDHVLAGIGFDIYFEILLKLIQIKEYSDPQIYKEDCRTMDVGMKENFKYRGYWPDNTLNRFRRYFDQMFDEYDISPHSMTSCLYINNLARIHFGSKFDEPLDFLERFFYSGVDLFETWTIGRKYRLQCYFCSIDRENDPFGRFSEEFEAYKNWGLEKE